jgi:dephospho-CoA kinase
VLREDGTLDRAKLGQIIFNDPSARARLSRTMRPAIWLTFLRKALHLFFREGHREVLLDVPLLFESGLSWLCSDTLIVYVGPETQRARLMARDAIEAQAAEAKMNAQWSLEKKKKMADVIIDNEGSIEELHAKLDAWIAAHSDKQQRHWWRAWMPTVPTVLLTIAIAPAVLVLTAFSRWMLL